MNDKPCMNAMLILKHELTYVLGQLQTKIVSVALSMTKNVHEHEMIKHEAAEAHCSISDAHLYLVFSCNGLEF